MNIQQMQQMMKKMGGMRDLMAQMPGMSEMIPEGEDPDVAFRRIQGMIDSMTAQERKDPDLIDIGRRRRIAAGVWLTACTYPIVVIVLPILLANWSRPAYLVVAEIFAPVAECALFWLAFGEREQLWKPSFWRDMAAIVLANLASFGLGEMLGRYGWF